MRNLVIGIVLGFVLVSGVAWARDTPDWSWLTPLAQPAPADGSDNMAQRHLPGSNRTFTWTQIKDLHHVADWFPDQHPAMPNSVATGHDNANACAYCHLPTGDGRPENYPLAGLSAAYIREQVAAFANGTRRSAVPSALPAKFMSATATAVSADELATAAAYFSKLPYKSHVNVVETSKLGFRPAVFVYVLQPGTSQPLGDRIIEVPVDPERFELRDPRSRFIAYVPPGSVAAGRALVASGGGARQPCAGCHGAGLRGGIAPPLAGRSPTGIMRQLAAFQTGTRASEQAALMRAITARLSTKDMIALSAYVATLKP